MATKQKIKKVPYHRNWRNISFVDSFTGCYQSGRYSLNEINLLERFVEVKIIR